MIEGILKLLAQKRPYHYCHSFHINKKILELGYSSGATCWLSSGLKIVFLNKPVVRSWSCIWAEHHVVCTIHCSWWTFLVYCYRPLPLKFAICSTFSHSFKWHCSTWKSLSLMICLNYSQIWHLLLAGCPGTAQYSPSHPCLGTILPLLLHPKCFHLSCTALKMPWKMRRYCSSNSCNFMHLYCTSYWILLFCKLVSSSWNFNKGIRKAYTSSDSEWSIWSHCICWYHFDNSVCFARWLQWSQKERFICFKSCCKSMPSCVSTLIRNSWTFNLRNFNEAFIFQASPPSITVHVSIIGPALAECLKDSSTPVRLAAERCAVHAFQMTKGISFIYWFNISFLLIMRLLIVKWD